VPPPETALGGLLGHMTGRMALPGRAYQPSSFNFGLLPALQRKARKPERGAQMAERARAAFGRWLAERGETDAGAAAAPAAQGPEASATA
jgi:methylenetetrahydrofolate--tRNA-(uracil-5-)-methyltransferase